MRSAASTRTSGITGDAMRARTPANRLIEKPITTNNTATTTPLAAMTRKGTSDDWAAVGMFESDGTVLRRHSAV